MPRGTRLVYGFGSVAEGIKNTAFSVFLLFYFSQVLGLPGTLAGGAIFLALCVDAVTDPLIGSISDNFVSRIGRRHPFMYAAAIPMPLCFYWLFNPPAGLGHWGLFAWMAGFAIGVRFSMTLFSIPTAALIAELTNDYDERTTLVSIRSLFGWMGGLGISQLAYLVFFVPSENFADGLLDPSAYGGFAAACAVLIFIAIIVCSVGTHHTIPRLKTQPNPTPFSWAQFVSDVSQVLHNHSYVNLMIASFFIFVAAGFNDVMGLYVNTYFWEFTTQQLAMLVWALFLAPLLAVSLTPAITRRFDKKRTMITLAAIAIAVGPLPVIGRLVGVMPENGAPMLLPLIVAHATVIITLVVAIGIVYASMIADTVDENELLNGRRQEGVFMAAIAFVIKATSGVGGFIAGIALDVIAFPTQAAPGAVPPETLFGLGLVVGPGSTLLIVVSLFFMARYRLTRERHTEILEELETRRQLAAAD